MSWIDVKEPFAAAPRVRDPDPQQQWDGTIESQGGWLELVDTAVAAVSIEVEDGDRVDIGTSTLRDVVITGDAVPELDVFQSTFERCDLSRVRFTSLRATRFVDCKLVGADFSGAELADVVFERCVLRFVNLRMTRLRRVAFVDCTLHEVDAYDLDGEDVTFAGSDLQAVNIDRFRAAHVDFRGTRNLGLEHLGSLSGCLVGEDQLHALTYQLAFAAGLGVERVADNDGSIDPH